MLYGVFGSDFCRLYTTIHLTALLCIYTLTFSTVLLDTKGPEIRTGFFGNGVSKIDLVKGETLTLTTDYHFRGDSKMLACSYEQLATSVHPGQEILVADGSLVLTVLTTDQSTGHVQCRIENNASIGERKNMNLPGVTVDLPTFTEKDVKVREMNWVETEGRLAVRFVINRDLLVTTTRFLPLLSFPSFGTTRQDIVDFGITRKVDMIAASFIRTAQDVRNLKKLLHDNGGSQIKIISKIENQQGLENFEGRCKKTNTSRAQ